MPMPNTVCRTSFWNKRAQYEHHSLVAACGKAVILKCGLQMVRALSGRGHSVLRQGKNLLTVRQVVRQQLEM